MLKAWICWWRRHHEMSIERVKPDSSSPDATAASLAVFEVMRGTLGGDIALNRCRVCGYIETEPNEPDSHRVYLILADGTSKPARQHLDDRYEASMDEIVNQIPPDKQYIEAPRTIEALRAAGLNVANEPVHIKDLMKLHKELGDAIHDRDDAGNSERS